MVALGAVGLGVCSCLSVSLLRVVDGRSTSGSKPILPRVCVILYFYTATCGPKGHGSGLPLPRGNGGFFEKDLFLSPIEMINSNGAPLSPSFHDPPDKRKKNKQNERKEKEKEKKK